MVHSVSQGAGGTIRKMDTQAATKASLLIGLIGAGIAGSRTPAMHEAAARALGLPLVYRRIDLNTHAPIPLPDLLSQLEWMGFDGLNITYPCKQEILPLMDELSQNAQGVSAVNTVVFRNGRRLGHNTDIWGFAEAFRRDLSGVQHRAVLQLGAGGAGAATAFALLGQGVIDLRIYDPMVDRSAALAAQLSSQYDPARISVVTDPARAAMGCDGIVNASPVGMEKLPGLPMPVEALPVGAWVADIIYFPMQTAFITAAKERGSRVMNGAGMALWQAVRAFSLFTDIDPDPDAMRAAFNAALPAPTVQPARMIS